MSRPLHSLTPAEVAELCRAHFGLDVQVGRFLAGEIAVNIVVTASGEDVAKSYVLKAEYPSPTMPVEHADWFCAVQGLAARAGLPVARQVPALHPYSTAAGESSGYLALVAVPPRDVVVPPRDTALSDVALQDATSKDTTAKDPAHADAAPQTAPPQGAVPKDAALPGATATSTQTTGTTQLGTEPLGTEANAGGPAAVASADDGQADAGPRVMLRLQEYLAGEVAASAEVPADYPQQVGRLTARLVAALAQAPAEPEPILHPWSFETTGRNVLSAADRIAALESAGLVPVDMGTRLSADVALARRVARAFETRVRPLLPELPCQVVHQDVNDFNILLGAGATGTIEATPGALHITGLIDFGDTRTAPRVAELAIAASYTMLGVDEPLAALRACVSAYAEASAGTSAELTDRELELVEVSALARLCLNACTWSARTLAAGLDSPDAAYGRARMARTWPVVRALAEAIAG